jgi:23S rRNA A2030 N6-methylase RlmJ
MKLKLCSGKALRTVFEGEKQFEDTKGEILIAATTYSDFIDALNTSIAIDTWTKAQDIQTKLLRKEDGVILIEMISNEQSSKKESFP